MKKLIIVITLAMASILYAESVATTGDVPIEEINRLLQTLITQHPWPPNDAIKEEKFLKSAEFIQLKELCTLHWDSVSDNMETVAGEDVGKCMLLVAFEDLEAESYITVLERMADKFHKNQINPPVMRNMIAMHGRKAHFLMGNHRHPRVQTLLKDMKPSFEEDAVIWDAITRIQSEQTKRNVSCVFIVSIFIIGVVIAWRYFKKK